MKNIADIVSTLLLALLMMLFIFCCAFAYDAAHAAANAIFGI